MALDLLDAFGTKEKTLPANLGGHTGVPPFEGDDGNRFFVRHLKRDRVVRPSDAHHSYCGSTGHRRYRTVGAASPHSANESGCVV